MSGPDNNPSPEALPDLEEAESRGTLVSMEELLRRAEAEGVDTTKIQVLVPRWAESQPRGEGVQSALVHCNLILRSDGSAVYLDGMMGLDSMKLAYDHMSGLTNTEKLPWAEWTASVTQFPEEPE